MKEVRHYWRILGWLVYPLLVAVFISLSANYLFGGESQVWDTINNTQSKVTQDQQLKSDLSRKLSQLKSLDNGLLTADLEFLTTTLPKARQPLVLIAMLQAAGKETAASMSGYKGNETAIVASYETADLAHLQKTLFVLEHMRPLLKIKAIKFDKNTAEITTEGLWSPIAKVSTQSGLLLPQSKNSIDLLRSQLKDYPLLPGLNLQTAAE